MDMTALKMAFSTELGRKTPYTDNLCWRIVWQRIAQEKPYRDSQKFDWYYTQHLAEI